MPTIVCPVYEDWGCIDPLLRDIDDCLSKENAVARVLLVDDGSPSSPDDVPGLVAEHSRIAELQVVTLERNLGHQRAIAVGLCVARTSFPECPVVVMDSDGEDRAEDIFRLLDVLDDEACEIAVARRGRRQASFLFRALHWIYRMVFRLFTGKAIDFGNFSALSPRALARVVSMTELWSHYPGTILECRLPVSDVGCDRGSRYAGESRMRLVSLILHGLRGMSVFMDEIFVRITICGFLLAVVSTVVMVTAFALKLIGHATPGWASNLIASAMVIFVQTVLVLMTGLLTVLRSNQDLLARPIEIYERNIEAVEVFRRGGEPSPAQGS
jgi:hypothetical protein